MKIPKRKIATSLSFHFWSKFCYFSWKASCYYNSSYLYES